MSKEKSFLCFLLFAAINLQFWWPSRGSKEMSRRRWVFQLPALADPCSVEWTDTALTILFKFTFPDTQPAAFSTGRPPRMKRGWGLPAQGLQHSVQLLCLSLPHSHHTPGH